VLVGINLLREGLDLPEVSLVAILDADREGFLRSDTSLIQITGRAARHLEGTVIMYGDTITGSMRSALDETNRRRQRQMEYNEEHGITPASIQKAVRDTIRAAGQTKARASELLEEAEELPAEDLGAIITRLEDEMRDAAGNLEFERAAELRDEIAELRKVLAGPLK
jgi:excinuclease ABC subunit B